MHNLFSGRVMADGGTKKMVNDLRRRLFTIDGAITLAALLVLVVGLFVGSMVGRVICGALLVGIVGYMLYRRWGQGRTRVTDRIHTEEVHIPSPEGPMKKLYFDDLQSPGGSYVVREVSEENVVPSTRTVQPITPVTVEEKVKEFEVSDFFDLDSDMFRTEAEPRSEFNFLLTKVLMALKEMLFAHSTAFFWANTDKQQMVLESRITESGKFASSKRFPMGGDIVSQVAESGRPQIVGDVGKGSETELACYYDSVENIQSIIAVPVYYATRAEERHPVGVIVADSMARDAFGMETIGWLGHFTKLVSALVKSYTDKYDLLLDSELLSSIRRMQDRIKSDATEYAVLNALADEANRLVNWDSLTIVMYSEERHGWMLQKVVNKSGQAYLAPDAVINFDESVVGRVIRSNVVECIDDVATVRPTRFLTDEQVDLQGSFLCVPISSLNRCYGALTLESKNRANFAGSEVETIYRLTENAALTLEVLYMNGLVKDHVIVDHLTGAATKKYFVKRLDEEIQRAEESDTDLSFVWVLVDGKDVLVQRYSSDGFEAIMGQVAKILRSNIRSYDLLGRMESDRFGALLISTPASDAYLWAEKLRKQVAGHVMALMGKSVSVTVSAGVGGLTSGMQRDQLLAGTTRVLERAIEHGGNLVQIF
jgi:diguanylate cyclase (GGDEF)-like protein